MPTLTLTLTSSIESVSSSVRVTSFQFQKLADKNIQPHTRPNSLPFEYSKMYIVYSSSLFLVVQDSSIGDLVSESVSDFSVFRALPSWLSTYDLSARWSEGWEDMVWPTWRQRQRQWFSDTVTQLTMPDKLRNSYHHFEWLTCREWTGQHSQFVICIALHCDMTKFSDFSIPSLGKCVRGPERLQER